MNRATAALPGMVARRQPHYAWPCTCAGGEVPAVTDPGDQLAAAGRDGGHLRASHADREQATEQLKVAFVQGRLDKDEFDARVGQALTARTYTELAAVIADLPAAPTAAQPPERAGVPGEARVLRPGAVLAAASAIYAGAWLLAFFLPRTSEGDPMAGANLVVAATFAYSVALVFAVGRILTAWQDRRAAGQLPGGPAPGPGGQAPGPGGQAPHHPPTAGPGGQLPWADPGQQHTAEAARRDPAHPRSHGSRFAHQWRHHRHGYAV
jgi:hypothetical protein